VLIIILQMSKNNSSDSGAILDSNTKIPNQIPHYHSTKICFWFPVLESHVELVQDQPRGVHGTNQSKSWPFKFVFYHRNNKRFPTCFSIQMKPKTTPRLCFRELNGWQSCSCLGVLLLKVFMYYLTGWNHRYFESYLMSVYHLRTPAIFLFSSRCIVGKMSSLCILGKLEEQLHYGTVILRFWDQNSRIFEGR
jgi:hypothetical protein